MGNKSKQHLVRLIALKEMLGVFNNVLWTHLMCGDCRGELDRLFDQFAVRMDKDRE